MSAQRDGITSFRRLELIEELSCEQKNLRRMLKLHFIDQELHEANRTSKEHIECVALHGYRTLLWTTDARVALEREHNRVVARLVATEIAHDILEWMLEGWHFGERPSRHEAVGYVPSMKKTGLIKAGVHTKVIRRPSQSPNVTWKGTSLSAAADGWRRLPCDSVCVVGVLIRSPPKTRSRILRRGLLSRLKMRSNQKSILKSLFKGFCSEDCTYQVPLCDSPANGLFSK